MKLRKIRLGSILGGIALSLSIAVLTNTVYAVKGDKAATKAAREAESERLYSELNTDTIQTPAMLKCYKSDILEQFLTVEGFSKIVTAKHGDPTSGVVEVWISPNDDFNIIAKMNGSPRSCILSSGVKYKETQI